MRADFVPIREYLKCLSLLEGTMKEGTESVVLMLSLSDVLEPLVFPRKGSCLSFAGIIRTFILLFLQMCSAVVTVEIRIVSKWLLVWAPWCVAHKRMRMNVPEMTFVCRSRFEDRL